MPPLGHPTKLTEALTEAIAAAVAQGIPLVTAGQLAGVSGKTVSEWIARGEGRDERPSTPLHVSFAAAMENARAKDEAVRIQRLADAARGGQVVYEKTLTFPDGRVVREVRYQAPQWTADAWFLERAKPEAWGRRQVVDMHIDIKAAAERVALETGMSLEEVLGEAQDLLKALDHAAY